MPKKQKPPAKGMGAQVQDRMREPRKVSPVDRELSPVRWFDGRARWDTYDALVKACEDASSAMSSVSVIEQPSDSPQHKDASRIASMVWDTVDPNDNIRIKAMDEEYNMVFEQLLWRYGWSEADAAAEARRQTLEAFSPPKRKAKQYA